MGINARAVAATVLVDVLEAGHALVIPASIPKGLGAKSKGQSALPSADRALVQELCYGVLRWQPRLAAIAAGLLRKPLSVRDADIHALVLIGLYQLLYLRVPPYAAVSETVQAARDLGKPWAAGLLNAVLRRCQREPAICTAMDAPSANEAARYAHPRWLLDRLQAAWPQDWPQIVAANNERPPMSLRVNCRHMDTATYINHLATAGLTATVVPGVATALILSEAVDVGRLPGFAAGWVSVQDAAAQIPLSLLDMRPGLRVLDACAAPGGKTALLLEAEPTTQLTALDHDPVRLRRVDETLARLNLSATVRVADATDPAAWWDGIPYDRILLDVPCSGTGVIRRHPDIKVLRRDEDIEALAARQARLLDGVWPLLAPSGLLLYVTCSVLPQENAEQITAFLTRWPDAQPDIQMEPIQAPYGQPSGAGWQILPGMNNMDGFFYARVRRVIP